ncbi:hypothetical protein KBD61_03930 [Patescibacteria group bacterium]|nr:hypothetical protein [Patescibacteria group bacterium]MBP9710145.1 hypothetical protein [Patescibacteria group bacterium]
MHESPKGLEVGYVRHGKAGYRSYAEITGSENPTKPFEAEHQITPDLMPEGREAAFREAEAYFDQLDPAQDTMFFVSSNEARAIETADVYRQVAHMRGFAVAQHDRTHSSYANELAGGEIRVLETLSINSKNLVLDYMFNPKAGRATINWEAVDPETRVQFERGAAIVEADPQGTFGANFLKHSEAVKAVVPEAVSAHELYEKRFRSLLKLVRWAEKKAKQTVEGGKDVKVLAFGHENAFVYALKEVFEEEGLNNCEAIEFAVQDGAVTAKYRGKERTL